MENSSLTIINNGNIRGILAPSRVISQKLLEDMIDFLELSSAESIAETEFLCRDADRKQSWVSLKEVERLARKAK